MNTTNIAIVGAGPSGLTLARLLQLRGIKAKVFEQEVSPTARLQGGCLDLHPETGQLALKQAELFDQFLKHARYDGEDMKIIDKHGVVHINELAEESSGMRPEIDRKDLRQILLDSIDSESVLWGRSIRSIEEHCSGKYVINVRHKGSFITEGPFDLIVGADGAWSKVRPILSSLVPQYSGLTYVECRFNENVDKEHPQISELCARGSVFILEKGKGLMLQRQTDRSIRVYVALIVPENWVKDCGIPFDNPSVAKPMLVDLYQGWDTNLLDLIRLSEPELITRPLFELPTERESWHTKCGVTLIGDAAHLTRPSGEGVNLAMKDSLELANALAECSSLEEAQRKYETGMHERAMKAVDDALELNNLLFAENSPIEFVEWMKSMMAMAQQE
jgi:2-polyprenyl-6-methoxyphenol hydroxylase-like FAD-dependent oxidoreductase